MSDICPSCGQEVFIGSWPWCPHPMTRGQDALNFSPIVVWQSNADSEKYSFPGQANEPVPAGYHAVEITNMRQADQLVARVNGIERRKMEETRDMRYALDDEGVRTRRREEDARGWAMRPDGTKFYIRGNSRAEALQRAVREFTDNLRAKRRAARPRIDPHFHNNALSFDSGNRNSYSGEETGWREKKK